MLCSLGQYQTTASSSSASLHHCRPWGGLLRSLLRRENMGRRDEAIERGMDGCQGGSEEEGGVVFPSGPPEAALVSITRREESMILTDDIPQHNASSLNPLSPSAPAWMNFIPGSLCSSSSSFSPLFLHEQTSHTPGCPLVSSPFSFFPYSPFPSPNSIVFVSLLNS